MAIGRVIVLETTWMLQRQDDVKKFAWHAVKLATIARIARATRHIGLLAGRRKDVFHNTPLRRHSMDMCHFDDYVIYVCSSFIIYVELYVFYVCTVSVVKGWTVCVVHGWTVCDVLMFYYSYSLLHCR